MLPQLSVIDIFEFQPDAVGINILTTDFGINSLPKGMGVYCFYDSITGIPVYIGSGCGVNTSGKHGYGLYLRMKGYLKPKNKHDNKIKEMIKFNNLLLKVWITQTDGDARKYEMDAIDKYKPKFNIIGCKRKTEEEIRQQEKIRNQKKRHDRKLNQPYDPERIRHCKRCDTPKKCSEFRRSAGKILATHSVCKQCEVELREIAALKRKNDAISKGIPYNRSPNELGVTQIKVIEILKKIGDSKSSDICQEIYQHKNNARVIHIWKILKSLEKRNIVITESKIWKLNSSIDLESLIN